MSFGLLNTLDPTIILLVVLITMVAGVIKGAVGFAMPLIMVSGISMVMDPKLAIAAIIGPIVVSNLLQTFRQGMQPVIAGVKEFWRYIFIVCTAIFITAQLVPSIPSRTLYFVVGIPVLVLSLIQLLGLRFHVPPEKRNWVEPLVATTSGSIGGLTGTWGPTTVLYLMAVGTSKEKQVIVQGIVFGAGSITILFAHLKSGLLNESTGPFTLALLPAALLGMWLGFKIHDRLDQERFRQITLIVLVVAALNLLRKGIVG